MCRPRIGRPNATLFKGKPDVPVELSSLLKGRKVLLIGIPGAYTPG